MSWPDTILGRFSLDRHGRLTLVADGWTTPVTLDPGYPILQAPGVRAAGRRLRPHTLGEDVRAALIELRN